MLAFFPLFCTFLKGLNISPLFFYTKNGGLLLTLPNQRVVDLTVICLSDRPDDVKISAYFLAMLHLYSELCLDRNYTSIPHVSKLLPRDVVENCIRNDNLPLQFRAAFAK